MELFMWVKYIYAFLSASLLSGLSFGCTQKESGKADFRAPEFAYNDTLSWQPLNSDILIGSVNDMAVSDSLIYILAPGQDSWLHAYRRNNGSHTGDYITSGEGPGEVLNATALRLDETNGIVSVFDSMTNFVHHYTIDPHTGNMTLRGSENLNGLLNVVRRCLVIDTTTYVVEGADGANTLARNIALAHAGKEFASYTGMPLDSTKSLALSQNTHWALSPDGTRMATSTLLGGVLETFDVSDNNISPLASALYFDPGFSIRNPGDRIDTDNLVFGFSSIAADNRHIFGAFSGTKSANDFHKIGIWDWNLSPVRLLLTDADVIAMAIPNDNSGTIYAVTLSDGSDFALQSLQAVQP